MRGEMSKKKCISPCAKPKQRLTIGGVQVEGCESREVGRTLAEDCRTVRQIMAMAEACLYGDKLDQDEISIYPQNYLSRYFLFWKV